ncbi:hypothetical protein HaLaN_22068 [Haematococcus lacustris]|uniref:Uncharacterized protein n=1 Tax=Haematococcus lacustris TaxID=44745 RepID=A0A699ZT01_HAELA|nr:hypothetical protein HaLaN_22068 [Haematococcus lacustris]
MVSLYEQLYVGLLNNLVAWGMPRPGAGQTGGSRLDAFTPTFMGALADCLVAICMVIGPPSSV